MIRASNQSQADRFRPARVPGGSDNFANLFRDPADVMRELVAAEVARRGFGDLRPALLAVGPHIRASGSRVTELAERSMLTKATVVYLVDELERLGYVRREPDPADGRAKLVVLTERGLQAEAAGRAAIVDIRDAWAGLVGEAAMARLEAELRRLRAALWPEL